jgi:hypothetical protein
MLNILTGLQQHLDKILEPLIKTLQFKGRILEFNPDLRPDRDLKTALEILAIL